MAETDQAIEDLVREFVQNGYDAQMIRDHIEAEILNNKGLKNIPAIKRSLDKKLPKPTIKKLTPNLAPIPIQTSTLTASHPVPYEFNDVCIPIPQGITPYYPSISDSYFLDEDEEIDRNLTAHFEFLKNLYQSTHNIQGFARLTESSDTEICVVGRVYIEEERDQETLYLEDSTGKIQLKLGGLETYSVFPGQIVMARGLSDSLQFTATELYTSSSNTLSKSPMTSNRKLMVAVAAGPFCTAELNFDIFLQFLDKITKEVNLLILIGPFVDSENKVIQKGNISIPSLNIEDGTYEAIFSVLDQHIYAARIANKCEVLLIPHVNEVCHVFPLPMPGLKESYPTNLECPCAPAQLVIDGIKIDVVPYDIVHELVSQTIIHAPTSINKITTALNNLFQQHCYMPVIPNSFPVEYSKFEHFCFQEFPNIFITTSRMPVNHTAVQGTICMRVLPFIEGKTHGSYAVINISKTYEHFNDGIGIKYFKLG